MAKPNLALIPATIGDKVYSILPSDGVGDFDFDRASTATRINAQGLIETVASGENRLNYSLLDGEVVGCPHLLLEPQSTNLITYSEDFSQSSWTLYGSIQANSSLSPNGLTNATKLTHTHQTYNMLRVSVGGLRVTSVFVKNIDANNFYIRKGGGSYAYYNFDTKTVNDNSLKVEYFLNDWIRLSLATDETALRQFGIGQGEVDSSEVGNSVYIWGAQVEESSYPTSYIKSNSGSATTRAAETCNGSGNAATFNDSEGVLMAEISALADDNNFKAISVSKSNVNNRITLSLYQNSLFVYVADGGVGQVFSNVTLSSASSFNKILVKYKQNDFSLWINGYELITDTSGNVPVGLNELSFDNAVGGDNFYGKTKQIQYFDSILDSEQLEQLTSWDSFRAMAQAQSYTIQ